MTAATKIRPPSREEIEELCILHAVGTDGCRVHDLAPRLGLSPELSTAMHDAVAPLVAEGRLDLDGDTLSVTRAGRQWMLERLSEWSPA